LLEHGAQAAQGLLLELAAASLAHPDTEADIAMAHGPVSAETVVTGQHLAVAIRQEREQSTELAGGLAGSGRVIVVREHGVRHVISKREAISARWLVEGTCDEGGGAQFPHRGRAQAGCPCDLGVGRASAAHGLEVGFGAADRCQVARGLRRNPNRSPICDGLVH